MDGRKWPAGKAEAPSPEQAVLPPNRPWTRSENRYKEWRQEVKRRGPQSRCGSRRSNPGHRQTICWSDRRQARCSSRRPKLRSR